MKVLNRILRFTQLIAALSLISGWFLHEPVVEFIHTLDFIDISRDLMIQIYYYTAAYVIGIIPVRWMIEKVVESKFML
jgi:DNA integrity scanning protein DisA with diadenylate cyclase activity